MSYTLSPDKLPYLAKHPSRALSLSCSAECRPRINAAAIIRVHHVRNNDVINSAVYKNTRQHDRSSSPPVQFHSRRARRHPPRAPRKDSRRLHRQPRKQICACAYVMLNAPSCKSYIASVANVAIDREVPCVYRFVAKRHRLIKNRMIIICPTK